MMKMNVYKKLLNTSIFSLLFFCGSCEEEGTGWTPDMIPDDPVIEIPDDTEYHKYKAPLYWSVYEYCKKQEDAGSTKIDIAEGTWQDIIDFVAEHMKPYGFDMICTDGFIAMDGTTEPDEYGYMTRYGDMRLDKLVAMCKAKGLKLGVYDNPLWVHGPHETLVKGMNVRLGDLLYKQGEDEVQHPEGNDVFPWLVASRKGAKEFIYGFFEYFKNMGVDYIRMDFLSWYEDGFDRYAGIQGRGYGREEYRLALKYICEAAKKYGVFTSLVMPHLYKDAEIEKEYGHMVRIVSDTAMGGWEHFSRGSRGTVFDTWPNCMNMFDGFVHWSHITGREKVILDGDFTRLNTFQGEGEKQSVISLQLMTGGPIAITDMPGDSFEQDDLKYIQNSEMLALNTDGFVGKPLNDTGGSWNPKTQIWWGQMQNGDYVVGLFNREDEKQNRSIDFTEIGIEGEMNVRDLWKQEDEGKASKVSVDLEAHSCKIIKLTK